MTLEHINTEISQAQALSDLEHMISLGDLRGQFLAFLISCKVNELSPRTIQDYTQKLGLFINFLAGVGIILSDKVTITHIRLFLLSRQKTCGPRSVKDYYGIVKRFFNWLVEEGTLEKNPMANTKPPRVPQTLITPFSVEHIREILSWCDDHTFTGARNRAIILTLLDTGLRLSEIASIKLNDVDFDRELIKVTGKGAKDRVVSIAKRTQKALLRYLLLRNDPYPNLWVTEERRPMQWRGIQIMIIRMCRRAELVGVRGSPHTFRHTSGTWAMLNGASEREVQLMLGHSSDKMTKRYTATITSWNIVKNHKRWSPVDNMRF